MSDLTAPRIVRPSYRSLDSIATLIAETYVDLPVARWLVPEAEHRARILHDYLAILIEHAFFYGHLNTTADQRAVAVWLHHTEHVPPPYDHTERLQRACGPYTYRFVQLEELLDARRPRTWHHQLAMLAVAPGARGAGLGSALLTHHHAHLDDAGLPAHLTAGGVRVRDLCLRHGYHPSVSFTLPDDAPFWPMWRQPRWR